jgi:hypothetical protein
MGCPTGHHIGPELPAQRLQLVPQSQLSNK